MLYVVDVETNKILFKIDAWYLSATEEAEKFIDENHLTIVKDEITLSGNKVLWVK